MEEVNEEALAGLARLIVGLAALLFLPAWTLYYWQAWVFLAVFSLSILAITLYLMAADPKLLERRVKAGPLAEKEKTQKVIQFIASLAFIAVIAVPSIDHRHGWSSVPVYLVAAGDLLVALGLLGIFRVFKENTFTAGTIAVEARQKVVSTGPYALVRHPMYAAAFVMLLGIPLALGSWWGFVPVALIVAAIIWRLFDEERFLVKNLVGYQAYRGKVRYRLVPYLW